MSPGTGSVKQTGGCLCGGVRYVVNGPLREVIACHCSQCRRTSGHYAAMSSAPSEHLKLTSSHTLTWYQSSATAERGFCSTCGSNLFWRQFDSGATSITAGTLDTPTGIAMARHIYVADKSDYYTLDDNLPKSAAW
ncbi:MAG TPA: GFA family protein [Steroidobacteraceae bacterium]|nr:GFA family protein [Steroidobacteraceae bacterium]